MPGDVGIAHRRLREHRAWWKRLKYDLHSASIGPYCEREGWETKWEEKAENEGDGDGLGVTEIQSEPAEASKKKSEFIFQQVMHIGVWLTNYIHVSIMISSIVAHCRAAQSLTLTRFFTLFLNFLFPTTFLPWSPAHVCQVLARVKSADNQGRKALNTEWDALLQATRYRK